MKPLNIPNTDPASYDSGDYLWDRVNLPIRIGPLAFDTISGCLNNGFPPRYETLPQGHCYLPHQGRTPGVTLLKGPTMRNDKSLLQWAKDVAAANQGWSPEA